MEMKKGRIYKVLEGDFWMLGRCIEEPSPSNPIICMATFIGSSEDKFFKNAPWCFEYDSIRTYREATKEEMDWFKYCESRSVFIPFEKYNALFSQTYQIY